MNNSILSLWHIMSQEQTIGLVKRLFLVDASVKYLVYTDIQRKHMD